MKQNKNFGSKGKKINKIWTFYENIGKNGYPCKNVTKYFCTYFGYGQGVGLVWSGLVRNFFLMPTLREVKKMTIWIKIFFLFLDGRE